MQLARKIRTQDVTFLVPDTMNVTAQERLALKSEAWLAAAEMLLNTAITRASAALVYTQDMSDAHKRMLALYFNVPLGSEDAVYKDALNRIIQGLAPTFRGLCAPRLTLADISQLPGAAKALACVTGGASRFAGVVYESPVEWASRLVGKTQAPPHVADDPQLGYICINYELMYQQGDAYAIVTLMHEASHKFARTIDTIYFDPKDGQTLFEHMESSLDKLQPLRDANIDVTVQEASLVSRAILSAHEKKKSKIVKYELFTNADSLANYAYDATRFLVQDFPPPEAN